MMTLNCIKCGTEVATADPESGLLDFDDGISLYSQGNYGSTVLDLFDETRNILVGLCDSCLIQAQHNHQVLMLKQKPQPDPIISVLQDWDQLERF